MSEIIIPFFLISIIIFIVPFIPYIIITGILLNKYNKLMYKKSTFLAYIPIIRLYLLGKYAFNPLVGFFIVLWIIINGILNGKGIDVSESPINIVVIIIIIVSIIITFKKYFDLKKGKIPNAIELEEQSKLQELKEQNKTVQMQIYDASNASIVNNNSNVNNQQIPVINNQIHNNPSINVEKKNCPKCGQPIRNDIKVCPFCGYSTEQNINSN